MATYIRTAKKINPAEYNGNLTDAKVDFILDEAALERKVATTVEVVLPVISGAANINYTVGDSAPDYTDGVTAFDEQQGDLTADITIDDNAVDLQTAGTYDLVYTVEDASGNEAEVTVSVIVEEGSGTGGSESSGSGGGGGGGGGA
jgi:hypothetical protein